MAADKLRKATRTLAVFLGLLCALNPEGPSLALELKGKPSVIDGDTLALGEQVIRLHGIDAAEGRQRCAAPNRKIARPGDMAEERLSALSAQGITCTGTETDDYGRLIAKCATANGTVINRALVIEGLAWAFTKYSNDYAREEAKAKEAGLGIWAMRCEEPWTFRAKRWEIAAQQAPAGCPIKGNVSNNGKIYHTPWSRHYVRTKVNTSRGERWFCSEGEAIKAGWRASMR